MAVLQPPDPHDPQPLSPHEHEVLDQIQNELGRGDPHLAALSASLDATPAPIHWVDRFLQVGAVFVILVVILPTAWLMMLVVLVVMVGPPLAAVVASRATQRAP